MNLRWKLAQYFEARWWRKYLQGKSPTAYLEWKRDYWKSFLEKIGLTLPVHAQVLDAGCGPAGIYLILDKNEVTAIDPLLEQYSSLFPHFQDNSLGHVRFVKTALEAYEAEHPFDLVFCLNAINHVADLQLCLQNLRKATKDGGKLVLSVDANRFSMAKWFFRLVPSDILHPHQYDLAEYCRLVEQPGFKVEKAIFLKQKALFGYYVLVLDTVKTGRSNY